MEGSRGDAAGKEGLEGGGDGAEMDGIEDQDGVAAMGQCRAAQIEQQAPPKNQAQLEGNKKRKPTKDPEFRVVRVVENPSTGRYTLRAVKPSFVDEGEHPDEVGVHAIEDNKKEQRRAARHVQALLDMDNHIIKEEIYQCLCRLNYDSPVDPFDWNEIKPQQQAELYQRLALYRIRGYDYEFTVDRKLAKLDDATLAQHYPPTVLYDENYFENYEESLEWYFDPNLCKHVGFEDYQRLVLRNYGDYRDWDAYKSTLHTYEKDLEYVQYCEVIENETKWVDDYLIDRSIPWKRVENVARLQLLKVAAGFPNLSPALVSTGFRGHICSVLADFTNFKGLDGVYFEIWKRVAK